MTRDRAASSALARRLAAAVLFLVLCAGSLGSPQPGAAWSNNGDGYATHDWILDQALRVIGGAPAWMNVQVALEATDDPDTIEKVADPVTVLWHVYKEKGRRGGAPNAILMRYAQAIDAVALGDKLTGEGDTTGARAAYDQASRLVGLLAHYEGDLGQPFHTAYAGLDDSIHGKYELLVGPLTRKSTDQPQWRSPVGSVTPSTDVRRTAIRTAAYSRQFFTELRSHLVAHPGVLDARSLEITGLVLRRASNDLGSIIAAIATKGGYGPQVKVSVSTRDHWIAADRGELIALRATDLAGHPVEGVLFTATIPEADGGSHKEGWATDANGDAHFYFPVRGFGRSVKVMVPVSATIGTTVISRPQWFMVTPALGSFRLAAPPAIVAVGQAVTARATARDRAGRGVRNLTVTFAWNDGLTTVRTTALTNRDGVAVSSRTFPRAAAVTVTAKTRSGSANWRATRSFRVR